MADISRLPDEYLYVLAKGYGLDFALPQALQGKFDKMGHVEFNTLSAEMASPSFWQKYDMPATEAFLKGQADTAPQGLPSDKLTQLYNQYTAAGGKGALWGKSAYNEQGTFVGKNKAADDYYNNAVNKANVPFGSISAYTDFKDEPVDFVKQLEGLKARDKEVIEERRQQLLPQIQEYKKAAAQEDAWAKANPTRVSSGGAFGPRGATTNHASARLSELEAQLNDPNERFGLPEIDSYNKKQAEEQTKREAEKVKELNKNIPLLRQDLLNEGLMLTKDGKIEKIPNSGDMARYYQDYRGGLHNPNSGFQGYHTSDPLYKINQDMSADVFTTENYKTILENMNSSPFMADIQGFRENWKSFNNLQEYQAWKQSGDTVLPPQHIGDGLIGSGLNGSGLASGPIFSDPQQIDREGMLASGVLGDHTLKSRQYSQILQNWGQLANENEARLSGDGFTTPGGSFLNMSFEDWLNSDAGKAAGYTGGYTSDNYLWQQQNPKDPQVLIGKANAAKAAEAAGGPAYNTGATWNPKASGFVNRDGMNVFIGSKAADPLALDAIFKGGSIEEKYKKLVSSIQTQPVGGQSYAQSIQTNPNYQNAYASLFNQTSALSQKLNNLTIV